jgi:branched-chain amino acid transport system substrate-binding protein
LIVSENSYELTDATIDSQIISMKGAGANIFMNITSPKFAAQAIRKAFDIGWRPLQLMVSAAGTVGSTLKPAGLEQSTGIVSAQYMKDPTDPRWKDDPGVRDFLTFMAKYMPQTDIADVWCVQGYTYAQNLVNVIKQCGDDLTRENLMHQPTNLKDVELPLLLPGLKVNTSPTNFYPIDHAILVQFDGKGWQFMSCARKCFRAG